MIRFLSLLLVLSLAVLPALAEERRVEWRVVELGMLGAIGIGEPCTSAQHDECRLKCEAQKGPTEILKKTRCEQTITPSTRGSLIPAPGYDCHCYVLEITPSEPAPPQPEPTGPEV